MTTLIIARHGNTFSPDDIPTRVGARTDLPLVAKGIEQAQKIGLWLKQNNYVPDCAYSSELARTKQTAEFAFKTIGCGTPITPLSIFNEIDYGPDENLTEDKVITRVGEQALKDWDEKAIVPDGWLFDPQECIRNWKNFAADIANGDNECVFVATSNGVARFAPHLAGNFEEFAANHKIKLSTGAIGILKYTDGQWSVEQWNIRP